MGVTRAFEVHWSEQVYFLNSIVCNGIVYNCRDDYNAKLCVFWKIWSKKNSTEILVK